MIDASKFNLTSPELEQQVEALVGPPGQWQARRDLQLTLLSEFGLTENSHFLDLGCGSLRLGLPLIDYLLPRQYTGVDVDPDCIAAAQRLIDLFDLQGKSPNIIQSESFGYEELSGRTTFDFVWIFQVFIHLPDELVRKAMKAISSLLADRGASYGTAVVDDRLETLTLRGKWRHYAYVHAPFNYYRDRAAEVGLTLTAIGVIDKDGWVEPKRPDRLTVIKMTRS